MTQVSDISVVIPLHNGAAFVADALASVLAQTLAPREIIVVDDGSTDSGPRTVRCLAGQYPAIILLSRGNGGQSAARNLGVAHAGGALIAFLDQDDVWYPHHLAELSRPFRRRRHPELGWAYSNLDEMDATGGLVARGCLDRLPGRHPKQDLMECLRQDMFILPSASLVSRRAFEAVGGFDERLSGYEDDDLFLRLFRAGYDHAYVARPLSKWRIHTASTSYSRRMAESRAIYARKLLATYPDDPQRGRWYARDMVAPRFLPQMLNDYRLALHAGQPEAARATLADLAHLSAFLAPGKRLMMAGLLRALRVPPLARALYSGRHWVKPLARRAFGLTGG